ncbi:hypothetical protein PT974_04913 [Cladobotryum mycophilum]|uniref:DUF8035 domain-containing protein n=1 Tax=Cladobotryum mycophilum TaxID=491253 RepID=A0ABR0SQQ8_9HYPO
MSGGSIVEHIDAVDAYARTLFVRAKQSPTPSIASDVSLAVQQLHLALRHLRIEAADPDSLINSDHGDTYSRQLKPIIDGSESALRLLEHILDRYGAVGDHVIDGMSEGVAAAKSKLAHEKTVIDVFLDLVQLDHVSNAAVVDGSQPGLEAIKDKLDIVAQRLFARRGNGMADDDDSLWQDFRTELEKEGFSSKVLREHKDVLRAYIRELQNMSAMNGGAPPTVQGLLDNESRKSPRSRELAYSSHDNEKSTPTVKKGRPAPNEAPILPLQKQFSYDRHSMTSEEIANEISDSLALISTRDLMAMDTLNSGMAGLQLQPPNHAQGIPIPSPQNGHRFLTAGATDMLQPGGDVELSRSFNSHPGAAQPFGQLQLPHGGAAMYGSSAPSSYGGPPSPRLAPDSYGRDIPLEAQWTRIKRTLVSPEVLHRAGVRYEARPEYVAVLGRLTRDEIAHFAHLSAECRAARMGKPLPERHDRHKHERKGSKGRYDDRDSESYSSDESDDDNDKNSEKGTKSYPVIVSPPEPKKTSPTATVMPKPILKNKNQNHVRFEPEPHEVGKEDSRHDRDDRDRRDHRRRDRDDRYKDDYSRRRDDDRRRRDDDRYHKDDRYRERDDDYYRHHGSDRDRKDDRKSRRRVWGETLGAVGIGGAAVSLLGILAEAAVGG